MLSYRSRLSAMLIGMLVLAMPLAKSDPSADARKTIQAAYAAENKAVENKDVKTMFVSYASDFTQTTKRGERLNLAGIKEAVPKVLVAAQKITDKTVLQKFSMKGSKASATVSRHTDLVILNPKTQKTMKIVVDAVSIDTWVKSGKTWKLKLSQGQSEQQSVDGKPVG